MAPTAENVVQQTIQPDHQATRKITKIFQAFKKVQNNGGIVIVHEPQEPGEPERLICGEISSIGDVRGTIVVKFRWQAEKIHTYHVSREPQDLILEHPDYIEVVPIGGSQKACLFNRHANEDPRRIIVLVGKGDPACIDQKHILN
ncbi:MAG: hypothetical protein AUJ28_03645 [Parcubacteria group bacterium CG1_02_37_51]|uniref:Uncharacterized protein n=2 Tax=Candidatus Komeiliibacteriota TaxID=1817908 RepID=A0A2M8DRM9_9BACT|nr:MAG: hypothetical protein AUJ28_03645 [Parcubacteria group bacterium CG1_02_37_51]PIY95234.1 MAG: hypothetical protein COY67_00930 [Candidatus Komeilibacteria bacterium CG_4_10_14_0_8_um_filter_37_78]PJC02040.1 MAG: hypothetical protein CO073_01495 [Candidatus Komeilibacteria bacterium CG_4_9_14_0_8_um_filter_36_9]